MTRYYKRYWEGSNKTSFGVVERINKYRVFLILFSAVSENAIKKEYGDEELERLFEEYYYEEYTPEEYLI